MPLNCPDIRTTLDTLALKQASFKVAIEEATRTGNFEIARQLKQEIEALSLSLHEAIVPTQIEQAEALFDKEHIITPRDIEKALNFQIEMKDVPLIPFTKQELQEATKKGQTLRLAWDILPNGTKLSGEKMTKILEGKQKNNLFSGDWYRREDLFKNYVPRRGWTLTDTLKPSSWASRKFNF